MLLLVDRQLGVWTCQEGGQASLIFDPSWGKIDGNIIGPQDATLTRCGTILILHKAVEGSYITEWCGKTKSFQVIQEIFPRVKNLETDKMGNMILVLQDESILYGPALKKAQLQRLRPSARSGTHIMNITSDIDNVRFASTFHPSIGSCIHYGFDLLEWVSYWFDTHWLGDLSDFALMRDHSIIIAGHVAWQRACEHRRVPALRWSWD